MSNAFTFTTMKLYLNLIIILLTFVQVSIAQSVDRHVVSSGGKEFSNSSARIAFTIGEPVTETFLSGNATATQGFHQGTINITSIREQIPELEISIFPNPTSDFLNVKINETGIWELYSLEGKLVSTGAIQYGLTSIDMQHVALATYTLTVLLQDKRMNTYRVIKTH